MNNDRAAVDEIHELNNAADLRDQKKNTEAIKIYERLIEHGHLYPQVLLANMYELGDGVPEDLVRAEALYADAATKGSLMARYYLGHLYEKKREYNRAFLEISTAAKAGFLPAANRLAGYFENGIGCIPDIDNALHYRRFAASHGHIGALRSEAIDMIKGRSGSCVGPWD